MGARTTWDGSQAVLTSNSTILNGERILGNECLSGHNLDGDRVLYHIAAVNKLVCAV
jgi:hypothetical protein